MRGKWKAFFPRNRYNIEENKKSLPIVASSRMLHVGCSTLLFCLICFYSLIKLGPFFYVAVHILQPYKTTLALTLPWPSFPASVSVRPPAPGPFGPPKAAERWPGRWRRPCSYLVYYVHYTPSTTCEFLVLLLRAKHHQLLSDYFHKKQHVEFTSPDRI